MPRPGRARNVLIGIQVTASALLLICAGVFLRSALASSTVDPGIRTADTVIVEIINEPMRAAMVAGGRPPNRPSQCGGGLVAGHRSGRPRAAFARTAGSRQGRRVAYKFVSPEYFSVLGIDVSAGRGFTPAEARRERGRRRRVREPSRGSSGPSDDAVGQVLHLEPDPNSETRRVDEPPLPSRTLHRRRRRPRRGRLPARRTSRRRASTCRPAPQIAKTSLTVRVHGDPELARRALLERLTAIDPNMGQVLTMRTHGAGWRPTSCRSPSG